MDLDLWGARTVEEWNAGPAARRVRPVDLTILIRAATDARMEKVWKQLMKRRGGKYRDTAAVDREDADTRHGAALVALLDAVVRYAMLRGSTITVQEAKQRHRDTLDTMEALLCDLSDMASGGPTRNIIADKKDLSALRCAFRVYMRWGRSRFEAEMTIPTKNESERHQDRWFVLLIAEELQRLYGDRMYGTTATIASVLTGREIKKRTVQSWASPPKRTARRLIPAVGIGKKRR
jgi:hypothetical protein